MVVRLGYCQQLFHLREDVWIIRPEVYQCPRQASEQPPPRLDLYMAVKMCNSPSLGYAMQILAEKKELTKEKDLRKQM